MSHRLAIHEDIVAKSFFYTKTNSNGRFSSILGLCWKYIKEKSNIDTQADVKFNDAIGGLGWWLI